MLRSTVYLFALLPATTLAGGVSHYDIAPGDSALSAYENTPSERKAQLERFIDSPVFFPEFVKRPDHANSSPGGALFDYDNDGDLDIFLPNAMGATGSLFSNQLEETGTTSFVDVTQQAGVGGALDQEGVGVTASDLDNDGDQDLIVTGYSTTNQIYQNNGDGTFSDISVSSGMLGGPKAGTSGACVGDLNGDGLPDVFITHSYDHDSMEAIFTAIPDKPLHNELFFNNGDMTFTDVSAISGILTTRGHIDAGGTEFVGAPGSTHACVIYDRDFDGDLDILYGDDQGAVPPRAAGGIDRGNIHLFENQGDGSFVDISVEAGINFTGSWMGLSVADYNNDGYLDFFASNLGDANFSLVVNAPAPGEQSSRWFFDGPNGFSDSLEPDGFPLGVRGSQFGWGTSSYDYDNDGDSDILYHGELDIGPFYTVSNPGVMLENDGTGMFSADLDTFAQSTSHLERVVFGVATGDLNGDGFEDVVTASAVNVPLADGIPNPFDFGGPFDNVDLFIPTFTTLPPGGDFFNDPLHFIPTIQNYENGNVSVEINAGENGNRSANVKLIGTAGLLDESKTPRDALGALVEFTTQSGKTVRYPIAVGDSYGSTNSLLAHFGLGNDKRGTLDVMWPGGVRNRLYNVRHRGKAWTMPEIPCSYDTDDSFFSYAYCVKSSVNSLRQQDVVNGAQAAKVKYSALWAYIEHHYW